MKAVVYHDVGDIRLDDVSEPRIQDPTDAIIRVAASAICGTDLHFVRGTVPGMKSGTILGHEAVGVVEEVGKDVSNFAPGDRAVVPSTIGCGYCSYCRNGYFAQCDVANPNGRHAGTAFFGGPQSSGPFDGLQAEYARIPFANVGLVKLPTDVSDDAAILLSDIFPTGYFAAKLAEIKPGDTVAVFGCGPVGQFAVVSAALLDAGRIFAIDHREDRLATAREFGAETINFDQVDPVEQLRRLTGGIGPDRVIDAVGVDAEAASRRPASADEGEQYEPFDSEVAQIAPATAPGDHRTWIPGDAPSQVLRWAVESIAKAGTLSIVGVYPLTLNDFPIGKAMNKNITVNTGNCNHRRYIPELLRIVRSGAVDPIAVLSQQRPLVSAIDAYKHFDRRDAGWLKVELEPALAVT